LESHRAPLFLHTVLILHI